MRRGLDVASPIAINAQYCWSKSKYQPNTTYSLAVDYQFKYDLKPISETIIAKREATTLRKILCSIKDKN